MSVFVYLLLCGVSLTSVSADCNPDGPENCALAWPADYSPPNHTCSWLLTNFGFDGTSFQDRHLSLNLISKTGNVTSRTACSTGGREQCLRFRYKFEKDGIIGLSVGVQYEGMEDVGSPLWTVNASHGWTNATVAINTTRDFKVVISAEKFQKQMQLIDSFLSVFLDDISYMKSPCMSSEQPLTLAATTTLVSTELPALPAHSTETPTATTTTTTTTTTKTTTKTTAAAREGCGADSEDSGSRHTDKPAGHTVSVTPAPQSAASELDTAIRAKLIATGVTIAILFIVIIVLTVLVIVLYRRKASCETDEARGGLNAMTSYFNTTCRRVDTDEGPGQTTVPAADHTLPNSEDNDIDSEVDGSPSRNESAEKLMPHREQD